VSEAQIEVDGGTIGLFGVTFLILMTLKLAGVASMIGVSWWWVTLPLWGPVLLFISFMLVWATVAAL